MFTGPGGTRIHLKQKKRMETNEDICPEGGVSPAMKLFLTKERRFWSQNNVLNPVLCISKKGTWKCDVVFTRIIVFALLLTISPLIWISLISNKTSLGRHLSYPTFSSNSHRMLNSLMLQTLEFQQLATKHNITAGCNITGEFLE